MSKLHIPFWLVLMLFAQMAIAQPKSITILSEASLQPIAQCELLLDGISTGIFSAENGQLYLPTKAQSSQNLGFFALGYKVKQLPIATIDTLQTVYLEPFSYNLRTVEIGDSIRQPVKLQPGAITVNAEQLSKLPTVLSEPDLLKALQYLPGVSSVMENNVGLFVRGGRAENALLTIDGAPVFNPSHSVGFFSVVHPASVKSATLYKDGIPAQYGGRSAAFLDVGLKEGNFKQFNGTASLGLISSYLDLQGPISRKKVPVSYQFVGRLTYIDKFFQAFSGGNPIFNTGFGDFSMKITAKPTKKRKLSLAYYHSSDHFKLDNIELFNFGNNSEWQNHAFSINFIQSTHEHWLSTSSLTYSRYSLQNEFSQNAKHQSGIQTIGAKWNRHHLQSSSWLSDYGIEAEVYEISPGNMQVGDSGFFNFETFTIPAQQLLVAAPYLSAQKSIGKGYTFDAHFRLSAYLTSEYSSLQPEPRLRFSKELATGALSLSYDRLAQFLQLYSANITPMPTDVWVASSAAFPVTTSNSLTFSYTRAGYQQKYDLTTALFYRHFNNVNDLAAGANAIVTPTYERRIKTGTAQAYGFEFMFQKKTGWFTGWLSYTYSRVFNRIDGILENGNRYPANHDKPHNLNVVFMKSLKKWEFNAVFVLQTGRPITKPLYNTSIITIYGERNADRLPMYHRADLSILRHGKKRKHYQGTWMLSIYNVYNRLNVYTQTYNPFSGNFDYLTLFPIIPTLSYKANLF